MTVSQLLFNFVITQRRCHTSKLGTLKLEENLLRLVGSAALALKKTVRFAKTYAVEGFCPWHYGFTFLLAVMN
jgi:hypothetical protein